MDNKSPEPEGPKIPKPDVKDPLKLQGWLDTYVTKPMAGFTDLKNADGTPKSPEQQLIDTKNQIIRDLEFRKEQFKITDDQNADYLVGIVSADESVYDQ